MRQPFLQSRTSHGRTGIGSTNQLRGLRSEIRPVSRLPSGEHFKPRATRSVLPVRDKCLLLWSHVPQSTPTAGTAGPALFSSVHGLRVHSIAATLVANVEIRAR